LQPLSATARALAVGLMSDALGFQGSFVLTLGLLALGGGAAAALLYASGTPNRRRQRRAIDESSDESSDGSEERARRAPARRKPVRTAKQLGSGRVRRPNSLNRLNQEMPEHRALNDREINQVMNLSEFQGFSMEETRMHNEREMAVQKNKAPKEVVGELQKGNTRFWMGMASRPELSAFERRALIMQQFPTVAVLGCSDSRVPVEIVFDCGLGDMFVVRVAGNALSLSPVASLEYAVKHLEVKVILVMGHEGCGALKAAAQPLDAIMREPEALATVLKELKGGLEEESYSKIKDARARDREMVTNNVRLQVNMLKEDNEINSKVRAGELVIVGAFYEISSGIVDFFLTVDSSST